MTEEQKQFEPSASQVHHLWNYIAFERAGPDGEDWIQATWKAEAGELQGKIHLG